MNAASSAAFLSGNDIGSIIPTESAPKTAPLIKPDTKFDMAAIRLNHAFGGNFFSCSARILL
jgi:hypothetical protein